MVLVASDRTPTQNWLSKRLVSISSHILEMWRVSRCGRIQGSPEPDCFPSPALPSHCVAFIPRPALLMRFQQLQPYPWQLPATCLQWKGDTAFNSSWKRLGGLQLDWLRSHAQPWTHQWGLGKWNELIGQAWLRCLPAEWEVRSVPPVPTERGRTQIRSWSWKGVPVRHSSGWVQIAGADSLHHILQGEGWT